MKIDLLLDWLKDIKTSMTDDFVDRMNYIWTTLVFVFFTFCIGFQQTFNEPLNCKPPANYPDYWVTYVTNYCFVTGTYHAPMDPDVVQDTPRFELGYYQWIPYILALQALSFYLPHLISLTFGKLVTNLNVHKIVERCHEVSGKKQEEVDKELSDIAKVIYGHTTLPHKKQRAKSLGNGLVYVYLVSKVLNILNIVANLALFAFLVGKKDYTWAYNIVKEAYEGTLWDKTGYFPRITYCDITYKATGQPQTFTMQCLLMINILTEKVFVLLHFWLLIVLAFTVFNFFKSVYELLLRHDSRAFIISEPFFIDSSNGSSKEYSHRKFYNTYLSLNGALLIRFVEEHAGDLIASKLVYQLANLWKQTSVMGSSASSSQVMNENQQVRHALNHRIIT